MLHNPPFQWAEGCVTLCHSHKREAATFKLPYKIRLGLTLRRISYPEGISISCKKEIKEDIQKQTMKLSVQRISSPSSIILYVPLQAALSLRTFTVMTPKVKNFMEFTCYIRKIYNCSSWCQNAMWKLGVVHFLFIMLSLGFLVSLNNIVVTFEASFLCSLSSKVFQVSSLSQSATDHLKP